MHLLRVWASGGRFVGTLGIEWGTVGAVMFISVARAPRCGTVRMGCAGAALVCVGIRGVHNGGRLCGCCVSLLLLCGKSIG